MNARLERLPIEIRQISDDDWRLWRDVRLRALAEAPYAFGSTLAYWQTNGDEERWRSRLRDVPLNLVAVTSESPVGQVSGSAADAEGRSELTSMWIDPVARGRGVGASLVEAVVEWARGCGAVTVVLDVKVTNAPAIALYERMGFEVTDDDANVGEVGMHRPLR